MTDRIYRTALRELSRVATAEIIGIGPRRTDGVALSIVRQPGWFHSASWEFVEADDDDAIAARLAREYPELLRTQPTQPHTYRSILRAASQMILAGDNVCFERVDPGYLVTAVVARYPIQYSRTCLLPANADDATVHLELSQFFAAIHR